jgi:homoserine O-acetyltransferase/O-succinyltransferase
MGGMCVLEYAHLGKDYVRSIAPIATSARHSAWGISWGEAQRQSIYSDPKYEDGYYTLEDPPTTGLGAARMSALLTYKSRDSFEARFGRNTPDASKRQSINEDQYSNEHSSIHNDGHKSTRTSRPSSSNGIRGNDSQTPVSDPNHATTMITDPQFNGTTLFPVPVIERQSHRPMQHYFSAQSYLRYQGNKFIGRFDANCYIAITRKLDTHDVTRNRASTTKEALQQIEQPTLVLGIKSDGLFTFAEQEELADGIPDSRLRKIDSPEGHDAFLLQFEQVNQYLLEFFREVLPDIMGRPGLENGDVASANGVKDGVGKLTKSSVFGEAEVEDLTAW